MNFDQLLKPYQIQIESHLNEESHSFGAPSLLREACEYALLNGGKRFRPALVFMVAEAIGKNYPVVPAALAVEFFHTASLIADDLPCMDNDDLRRNKPSLHKAYGETTALLSTYALIAAGYEKIYLNSQLLKETHPDADSIGMKALENATFNTGIHGATGGQFLDIYPPQLTENDLRAIIHKKTVTLFEISFVFGWLFGGGNPEKLSDIKQVASHFGMAFQIIDDFADSQQDIHNKRYINYPNAFGKEHAAQVLQSEVVELKKILKKLNLHSPALAHLTEYLSIKVH